ncbi:gliding motility-associated C-terminal domain-containing protein [Odoribacter lunatus]|uniref:gliding motility-associated C-terminal domain-containing protein n=1 Tax=Odoribacter lunatus TaxID=2941335 RepID=UPI00203C350E|nr:gliding motility-associated C-terminal domain-containing protein [Odoribacter lunatus]
MKYLWILCISWFCVWECKAQLPRLEGCVYTLETVNTPDGMPFFAVKDVSGNATGGRIRFDAPDTGWIYKWVLDGVEYTEGNYASDSSFFTIPIQGNGVYAVYAEKEGEEPVQSGDFRIFYVHVPEFGLSIVEETRYDCEGIKLKIDDFQPAAYVYGEDIHFYGTRDVEYLISGRTTPITSTDYEKEDWEIFQTVDEKDTKYTITITDKFGLAWESTGVEYISVIPKAKMDFKLLNTVQVDGYGTDMGQAPLDVEFMNESVNAQSSSCVWYLYKDTADLKEPLPTLEDSLMDNSIRYGSDFTYTYEHPGLYRVRLKAVNTLGPNYCWDTTELRDIKVIQSLVNVPNVFTPNGDGVNDVFRVQVLSSCSFHAVIINRWGRKVYEWSDQSGGWDGRINGKYANPGTYYYIVTARGLEKNNPPKYVKKGALLLVR